MEYNSLYLDVVQKYNSHNKILFNKNSKSLQPLVNLISQQNHRTLILWAFDIVEDIYRHIDSKFICHPIILNAIKLCKFWSKGQIKMSQAKSAILEVHSLAKETTNPSVIANLHAIGQGLSTVHVKTHALGIVYYELTSLVLENGIINFEDIIDERINHYTRKLLYFQSNIETLSQEWARFLQND